MKVEKEFGDMTPSEIEKFEKDTNSVVLFHNERGVAFQRCEDYALAIIIDGRKNPLMFEDSQIERLKEFINKNF